MESPFKPSRAANFGAGNRALAENERSPGDGPAREGGRGVAPHACPGCGCVLAARLVVDAAMRAAGNRAIVVDATECLDGLAPPAVPRIRSLAGNAAAVACGVAAGVRAKGRADVRVIALGSGGATGGIGAGGLAGTFERDDDVLCVACAGDAYLCAGAALRDPDVATGGARDGVPHAGTSLPMIAMAHGIAYVATASVADLPDLERKVTRAVGVRGTRYVHVHAPCPLAWGSAPDDTIRLARLAVESGLFPLFEAERGEITGRTPIRRQAPVGAYLEPQARFAGLFGPAADAAGLAAIQATADRNIARFGLLA